MSQPAPADGDLGAMGPGRSADRWGIWFFHPLLQLSMGAILVTVSELLLRRGAEGFAGAGGAGGLFGIAALASGWTWLGIICYVASFLSWILVLRRLPLSIAFPAINVVHVLIPIGCWIFLGEAISLRRWMGIALVVCGILLLARPFVKAEEQL
jgi:multidrug transporter EmrE-like cation transporter